MNMVKHKSPLFTKRHYEFFATFLGDYTKYNGHSAINAVDLADVFESDNPRFDRDGFLHAVNKRSR